jgi:hypothetical protein
MGKNNKQRRKAKQRQRQRAASRAKATRHASSGAPHEPTGDDPPRVEAMVRAAVWSWETDPPAHVELLDTLDARADRGEPVLATVRPLIDDALDGMWGHGWTPADAVHITARLLSTAHADVVSEAIVANGHSRNQAGQPPHRRWQAQLDMLEARRSARGGTRRPSESGVRLAVTVLCLLMHVPSLPSTMPGPGQLAHDDLPQASPRDERMLARVRALLAKAESTEFEEEAEALTAKAQELIARHAIAEALLHTPDDVGDPLLRRILLNDPYIDAKAALLSRIAAANRCRAVYTPACGWVTVFGYNQDLNAVELLTASLLTQATSAMARHGSRRDAHGRSTTRSFRRSFLLGFANRIGERLRHATDGQVDAAASSQPSRLLPVLAARDDRLRAAEQAVFPDTLVRRTSISNSTGWAAGQAAADLADLNVSVGALHTSAGR